MSHWERLACLQSNPEVGLRAEGRGSDKGRAVHVDDLLEWEQQSQQWQLAQHPSDRSGP